MACARFKDLCIDTSKKAAPERGEGERLGRFWAKALGLTFRSDGGGGVLDGERAAQRMWINVVPESKTVKHRVHLDVTCQDVDELVRLGARVLEPPSEDRSWTVMADPEGGEFCAFVRQPGELASYRLLCVIVDAAEPERIARWWGDVFGVHEVEDDDRPGWWWVPATEDMPFGGFGFLPVPEPKTVKNRIHWDVLVTSVDPLLDRGAELLRTPTTSNAWSVLADPEGNEFCAFVEST